MPNHWSLVMFTLMVQSAVGSVWCVQAALFWDGGLAELLHLKFQILAALCLVLTGLAAAMSHLGNPGGSLHAVKNFKSSWLSREIFSVNVFAGFLAVMAVLAQIRPGVLNVWVLLGGSLAGGTVLYAMTRVYRLRTVPAWNHAGTALTFLGSALLLGGLVCTLVMKILTLLTVVGHDAMGQNEYRSVVLIVVLAGLAAAMSHLGNPGDSLHAAKNLKSSWLSREIFSVNIFAGFLAVMVALAQIRPGALNVWVLLVGSLAGGAVLSAMTRVYRLRTVPAWNHAGTSLTFLGSALLLGGLVCTLVLKILTLLTEVGHDVMGQNEFRNVALIAVLAGFILKMLAAGLKPSGANAAGPFKALQPVMQGAGVALWLVNILAGVNPVFQSLLLFLAAGCLVSGEIIHRIQFYSSYQRVGL
jgi:DMSO reductase anchor subunit